MNATPDPIGAGSIATAASDAGKMERKAGSLDSFKSETGAAGASSGAIPKFGGKSGKGSGKKGRPPNNAAGFSKPKIDEVVDDPAIEDARVEFEEAIVELLVATTDGLADKNFLLLKQRYPEAEARGLADKFKLTDKEKKYFGAVAIRLWRKYLGDDYLFTDESIAGIFLLKYCMRNFEGYQQARKIESYLNGKSKSADQQPRVQSPPNPGPGHERNGQDNAGDKTNPDPSRAAGSHL